MNSSDRDAELRLREARSRHLARRFEMALAVIDRALAEHGSTRHDLLDALLDVRCLLAPDQ